MTVNLDNSLKKPNFLVSLIKNPPRKILAPICALLFILTLWQILCSGEDANLPSPIKTFQDTAELIFDPFLITVVQIKVCFGKSWLACKGWQLDIAWRQLSELAWGF